MDLTIQLTEQDIKHLVYAEIARRLGDIKFEPSQVKLEVKSKQNYKSEWETAAFRAYVTITA